MDRRWYTIKGELAHPRDERRGAAVSYSSSGTVCTYTLFRPDWCLPDGRGVWSVTVDVVHQTRAVDELRELFGLEPIASWSGYVGLGYPGCALGHVVDAGEPNDGRPYEYSLVSFVDVDELVRPVDQVRADVGLCELC